MSRIFLTIVILFSHFVSYAQLREITGVVRETTGEVMPGASVVVLGTTRGTTTDINGEFRISASSSDSIQISFFGKRTETELVGARNVMNVTLLDDDMMLEELVVTAFGTQTRERVASSIESVRVADLRIPSSNLTTALAGRVSGLISYQTTGEPGADNAQFFVRGIGSFGQVPEPLVLIDGFESSIDELARLRPDDIESFSVMKDAAATVMYGARSANGIISVTTKSGYEGPTRISARFDINVAMPTRRIEYLDGVTYMRLYNEAYMTRNPEFGAFYDEQKILATSRGENPMIYPNVDWYNELFSKYTVNRRANLSVSGGGQVANYFVAGGFEQENGLLKVDNRNNFNNNISVNRANLRSNVTFKLGKTTTLDTRIQGRFERYNGPFASTSNIFSYIRWSNPVDFPFEFEPDEAHRDVEHILFGATYAEGGIMKPNPYAEMVSGYEDRNESSITMQATLNQDLSFLTPGLKLSLKISANSWSRYQSRRAYIPFFYTLDDYDIITQEYTLFALNPTWGSPWLGNVMPGRDASVDYYYEGIVNWGRAFGRHDFGFTAVALAQEKLLTGGNSFSIAETLPEKNLGISGKVSYMLDSKYIVEFIYGYNGSEKFHGTSQWGFFPAVAAAWWVSRESFFEPLKPVVESFKIKGSMGRAGNDAIAGRAGRFFFLSDLSLGGSAYNFGSLFNNWYPGFSISRYANPNITWETSDQFNIGFEMGLFRNEALKIHADAFYENRSQIYLERENFPASAGLEADISGNVGKMKKYGVDGSIDYMHVFSNNLWISGRANFIYSRNEYVERDEPNYSDEYLRRVGHPHDQQWGLLAERLFVDDHEINNSPLQTFSEYMAGDIKYKDINNDGVINGNDYIPMGHPTSPEIQYGFGLSGGYKRWDLSFFFQGNARVAIFINPTDEDNGIAPFVLQSSAMPLIADNYWSVTNPDPHAFWPRLSTTHIENNTQRSSWWLRDGSFVRLKAVEVGYNITGLDRLHLQLLRLYVSGENLFVMSKFKLWDPEMGGNGLRYPPNRRINFGIKLDF